MLPQYPSYYNGQDPSKQITVMRNYIISLKDELEQALADIKYENLDPALRKKFDAIDNTLANLKNATRTIEEDIKVNYDTEADIDDVYEKKTVVAALDDRVEALENDHVTEQAFSDLEDRVETVENAVGALQDIDAGNRLDALEGIDADNRLNALEGIDAGNRLDTLEQKAVTTDNTETIIADKNLKVASIKIGSNTYTEQTVTISGTTIHFLGY